jgi:hypothetical protein
MYEYGTLKLEVILRRGRGKGRIMEGMNRTGVHCAYIYIYIYMEISLQNLCTTILH